MLDPDRRLSHEDVAAAADRIAVEPAALEAVLAVECGWPNRTGFDIRGRPVILLEAHHVYRLNGGISHPGLSTERWDRSLYTGSSDGEWRRFADVARLWGDDVAIQACSWGLPQIMGFNHRLVGFDSPALFREHMEAGAGAQVEALCAFLDRTGLVRALREGDWAAFARGYNGPRYAENRYDTKLADAYRRAGGSPAPAEVLRIGDHGSAVVRLQQALTSAGFRTPVDGDFGPLTEVTVERFQAARGLAADGIVGPRTWAALGEE